MVGIVIVSHSAQLADGVRELAEQMVQGRASIAVAGGIDDPENPIGTDVTKVLAAIESVYSDDGVVVLMDLGSALLSAEMALEFLPPEQQANVHLLAAPLVEGTIAAAVQASVGGTVEQVVAEARGALAVKVGQLQGGTEDTAASSAQAGGPETGDRRPGDGRPGTAPVAPEVDHIRLIVRNRLGLHARPAAQFVSTANRFAAEITVVKGEQSANAKSINQVATLGVRQGDEITVAAAGSDAAAALQALQALAEANFGETDEGPAVPTGDGGPEIGDGGPETGDGGPEVGDFLVGIAASPGIGIGPVALYRPRLPEVRKRTVTDVEAEQQRLDAAVAAARQEIEAVEARARRQVGEAEAAIFQAHQLFLQDPALVGAAKQRIADERINAEAAWQEVVEAIAGDYRALDDAYLRGRAADVEDVGRRVLRQLMAAYGWPQSAMPSLDFEEPSIVVAADLAPSDTAQMDPSGVLGIVTELGGATAHSAILARALGIPAVVGLGPLVWTVAEGQTVAIDGEQGRLWLRPDEAELAALREKRDAWLAQQQEAKAAGQEAAMTRDGRRIEVAANIGGLHDVEVALEYGAEGVGLFRTEFLFMERAEAPSEAEQLAVYRQVAAALGQRPLIIRTLDVGGDKPLPYLDLGREENPFLGWRGLRFCLDHPEIFEPQLRAILQAGVGYNVKVMFPMVSSRPELQAAKRVLAEVQAALRAEGIAFDETMEVGIMIEVPAAVAVADQLAAEVDFFSIGTNDLTQYVMAADRGNARVAGLANALQPAVLRLVRQTVEAGHKAGIWVGMCGELAGNVLATPLLVGLGLDELSMNAPAVPGVKAAVRELTVAEAERVADAVLGLESAAAVEAYLEKQRQ